MSRQTVASEGIMKDRLLRWNHFFGGAIDGLFLSFSSTSRRSSVCGRRKHKEELFGWVLNCLAWKKRDGRVSQAVTKDLSSSSKFSGSCVLTLQTLLQRENEASVKTRSKRERRRAETGIHCLDIQHERCNDFFSVTSRVSQKLSQGPSLER